MSMILCIKSASDEEIANLVESPETIEDFIDDDAGTNYVELDKAWHGIHFLLTGSDWAGQEPLCYLLSGGETIGDIDVGYGPARALSSTQVVTFETELAKIDEAEFRRRFNPTAMMASDIYPTIWDRPIEEDDTLGYLCSYFADLKNFLKDVRKSGRGIVVWMS